MHGKTCTQKNTEINREKADIIVIFFNSHFDGNGTVAPKAA